MSGLMQYDSAPATSGGRVKGGKGTCTAVRVERATNGFTLNKTIEGPHGEYMGSGKPEVFTDAESMVTAVKKALA